MSLFLYTEMCLLSAPTDMTMVAKVSFLKMGNTSPYTYIRSGREKVFTIRTVCTLMSSLFFWPKVFSVLNILEMIS
jgi:hypothetical protein